MVVHCVQQGKQRQQQQQRQQEQRQLYTCISSSRRDQGLEGEAISRQGKLHCCVAAPRLSLPLHAASHEMCIHASHRHTHPLPLELTAMVAGVSVPAMHMHSSKQQVGTVGLQERNSLNSPCTECSGTTDTGCRPYFDLPELQLAAAGEPWPTYGTATVHL